MSFDEDDDKHDGAPDVPKDDDTPRALWICNIADNSKWKSLRAIFREVSSISKNTNVAPSHASWCRKEGPHKDDLWLRFASPEAARTVLAHTFTVEFGNAREDPVTCTPALKNKSSSFTQIFISNMVSQYTTQDVTELLEEHEIKLATGVSEPIHFYPQSGGRQKTARVRLADHEQYKKALQLARFKCSLTHCVIPVRPYVSNIKYAVCTQCRTIGHTKAFCKKEAASCPMCGKPNHGDELCDEDSKCPLCNEQNHGAEFKNPQKCSALRKLRRDRTANNKARSAEYLNAVLGSSKASPSNPHEPEQKSQDKPDPTLANDIRQLDAKVDALAERLDELVRTLAEQQQSNQQGVSTDAMDDAEDHQSPTLSKSLSLRVQGLEDDRTAAQSGLRTLNAKVDQIFSKLEDIARYQVPPPSAALPSVSTPNKPKRQRTSEPKPTKTTPSSKPPEPKKRKSSTTDSRPGTKEPPSST